VLLPVRRSFNSALSVHTPSPVCNSAGRQTLVVGRRSKLVDALVHTMLAG
jgi:hypothetical protein